MARLQWIQGAKISLPSTITGGRSIVVDCFSCRWQLEIKIRHGHQNDRIFITYGSNHLSGIFRIIQERDPTWRVESVKWLRTVEPPKQYEGELNLPEAS